MKILLILVLAPLLLSPISARSGAIAGSSFRSGDWEGAAWADDNSGRFRGCSIQSNFASGEALVFTVNRDATITVSMRVDLGPEEGQVFPVVLRVDNRRPFLADAVALNSTQAVLEIEEFGDAMMAFRKGYVLRVEALGKTLEFSLRGTYRALEKARLCANEYFDYPQQGIGVTDGGSHRAILLDLQRLWSPN